MNNCCVTTGTKPRSGPPISERIKVWWKNRKHRRVCKAIEILSAELRKDHQFAHVWMCNIAMPIFDASREMDVSPNWVGPIPATQCNAIAKRLMKHLFDVDNCDWE